MITWVDPKSGVGYFAMLVVPPKELAGLPRRPMELVFVVDASGSMSGVPIEQAKDVVAPASRCSSRATPSSSSTSRTPPASSAPRPWPRTTTTPAGAERDLNQLAGAGGTMMINGIKASLDFPRDGERTRFVCFLTDGFIGNEAETRARCAVTQRRRCLQLRRRLGPQPLPHRAHGQARRGRGCAPRQDDGGEVMSKFFDAAAHPALSGLAIDWPALDAAAVYPASLPDVYVGRPVVITGRFDPALADTPARLTGAAGDIAFDMEVPVTRVEDDALARGLRAVWARNKIAALMDEATYEPNPTLAGDVKTIALEHSLMSAFTAFIAVDLARDRGIDRHDRRRAGERARGRQV